MLNFIRRKPLHITRNDHLADVLLDEMMEDISEDRTAQHPSVTDLIDCLTKKYLDNHQPLKHETQTKVYFLIGLGLEKALLPRRKESPTYGEFEGVHYHVDSFDKELLLEVKSTRMQPKKLDEGDFSERWLKQAKSYCVVTGTDTVNFCVVFLIQAQFTVYQVRFEKRELEEHWAWMQSRKERWLQAEKENWMPEPFQWNQDWECKDCQYLLICQTVGKRKLQL